MDIKGLVENLDTLSDILKSNPIRESVNADDFKNSYERFEAALSDLRVTKGENGKKKKKKK